MADKATESAFSPCVATKVMLEEVLRSVLECREAMGQQAALLTVLTTCDANERPATAVDSHPFVDAASLAGNTPKLSKHDNSDASMSSCTLDGKLTSSGEELAAAPSSMPSKKRASLTNAIIRDLEYGRSGTLRGFADAFEPGAALPTLRKFIVNPRFDFMMSIVIFINSVYIGFQIDNTIHSGDESPPVLDYLFLVVYIVELGLRFWASGIRSTLRNGWNVFDALLVAVGSFSLFVIEPIYRYANLGHGATFLQQITVLRLVRLLRLVRSLRLLQQFKILWNLTNGLLHALPVILSTLGLLCLLIYIFACGGIELITKNDTMQSAADNDPLLREIVDEHFSTLPMFSLTLIRFTTMDSIGAIYEPLIRVQPSLLIYFVLVLLIISITIMNLITAILVEHSLHMAKTDSELEYQVKRKRLRQVLPRIEDLFQQMDQDGDGFVTRQEATSSDVELPKELADLLGSDTFADLFEALDADESGIIDKDEFVEGLGSLALSEIPVETWKLLHYGRLQNKEIRTIRGMLHALSVDSMAANELKLMMRQILCNCCISGSGVKSGDDCGIPAKEKGLAKIPSMPMGAASPKGLAKTPSLQRRREHLQTPRH